MSRRSLFALLAAPFLRFWKPKISASANAAQLGFLTGHVEPQLFATATEAAGPPLTLESLREAFRQFEKIRDEDETPIRLDGPVYLWRSQ